MSPKSKKLISLFLSFCLIFEQAAFAQSIDLSHYFANSGKPILPSDKFRPLHLRYLGYDNLSQDFKILLDKGDTKKEDLNNKTYIEENTQTLLKYFFVGLALPNEKFWVNLRLDSPDNIIDSDLEKTDIGRIFLEADLQLKKDTSSFTSPQTPEGKAYWDKLYQKAGELFGTENITIPTLTRPWIVPNEIIIREAPDNGSTALTTSAYIYKATLKVMLEEDYLSQESNINSLDPNYQPLTSSAVGESAFSGNYNFSDPRLKELNEYSTQLIRELIIPKLTYQVNTSKRYAPLRQVYYSLILAQWFKQKHKGRFSESSSLLGRTVPDIDSGDLTNLTSKEPYDKQAYFKQYQKSFKDGEYNLTEPVYTPLAQSIRRYMSGGANLSASPIIEAGKITTGSLKGIFGNKATYLSEVNLAGDQLAKGIFAVKIVSSPVVGENWEKENEVGAAISAAESDFDETYHVRKEELINMPKRNDLSYVSLFDSNGIIKITTRTGAFFTFKICENNNSDNFTYKWDYEGNILYIRNLKTGEGVWITFFGDMGKEEYKRMFYMDWFNEGEIEASDYEFHHNVLTNLETNATQGMSEGIIDFTKISDNQGISELLKPSASSAVVSDKIQQYIDKIAEVVFDPEAKQFIKDMPLEGMPSEVTIEKLVGGNRGSPIYRLSIGEEDVAVKFFPPGLINEEMEGSYFAMEVEALLRANGKLLFQQGMGDKAPTDRTVGYIVTKFIPGKSFHIDIEKWDLLDYQENLKNYVTNLKEEIESIPKEHWKQLVSIYEVAEQAGIIIDASPNNFKYDKNRGFVTLDYLPRGGYGVMFDNDLKYDVVHIVTGFQRHVLGDKNKKLIDYIDKAIANAKKGNPWWVISTGGSSTSSSIIPAASKDMGGIDMRVLPIVTQQINSLQSLVSSPLSLTPNLDLDAEWTQIQQIFNAGIQPSVQRLVEFSAAAASSLAESRRKDDVLGLIADLLRREEEDKKLTPTDPALKGLLSALETIAI